MANSNSFYTAENLASAAVLMAEQDRGLAALVSSSFEANFAGARGHSVNIKRPNVAFARQRVLPTGQETAITLDSFTEAVVSISLDIEAYHAAPLSDYDLTLKIEDFAGQVTQPQTAAIVRDIEAELAGTFDGVTPTIDYTITDSATIVAAFQSARATLRKSDTPMDGLVAVCGVDAYGALLDFDLVDTTGGYGKADGMPQVRGFRVVENNRLSDERIVFMHPVAFHLAVRAPVVPAGVTFGASTASGGFALRLIRDYDPTIMADRQIVNTYYGIDALGFQRIDDAGTGVEIFQPVVSADPSVV